MVTVGGAGSSDGLLMLADPSAVLLDVLPAVLFTLTVLLAFAPLLVLVLSLEIRGLPVALLFL